MKYYSANTGSSLEVQWSGLHFYCLGTRVQSLLRQLRSCKLCGKAKKKKEWSAETFYNRGKPQKHAAVSEHDLKELRYKRPHIVWFHLYEKPNIGKPVETDSLIAQSVNRSEWVLSHLNLLWLFAIPGTVERQAPLSRDSSVKNTGVGFFLQGIFLTQGWSLRFLRRLHWQGVLYH